MLTAFLALFLAAPQSQQEAVQKSQRANALVQSGAPEQAIPIYKELMAAFPAEPSFQINLAVALFKAGRYAETITQCDALRKQYPNLFPAWLFLGASHLKLGDAAAAEGPLRKSLEMQPGDSNARLMLADALSMLNRWAEAVEQYETVSKALPDNPRVWFGLGRGYDALEEESLAKLEASAPASAETLALSAQVEFERGQMATAFERCRQALALQPSLPGMHALIAQIYDATGHSDWAVQERAKYPETAHAATPAAQAYARLEQLPPSHERFEARAIAEEKRGRYPEATSLWKEALRFDPTDAELQKRLALALCHSNDCASAVPIFQSLLAHMPGSAEMNYLCGLALVSTRNAAQALLYLEAAVHLDGTFLPARAVLGEAYLQVGSPNRAIPNLKAALATDEDGQRHYQLAQAYQAAGMHDESRAALREYRESKHRRAADQQKEPRITPP